MSIDWQASLYDPIYDRLGVEGSITPIATGIAVDVVVRPELKGVAVTLGPVDVQTLLPAARVRMYELTGSGLSEDDLDDGILTFAGKSWKIKSHKLSPNPDGGELRGEVYLFLGEVVS